MKKEHEKIFKLATPYLKKGIMKDFIAHTKSVVKAMELLIDGEGGDSDILIPATILHDVGFSKVSPDLQTNGDLEKKREAQRQHLILAREIIEEILTKLDYDAERIERIIGIVETHKFQDPGEVENRMLIDADNLSDTFKEQFYSDVKVCGFTPSQNYGYRIKNEYYTDTAKKIAAKNMAELKKEIDGKR